LLPGSNFTHLTDPQNSAKIEIKRSKRPKKIKESKTTSIPRIPSHSKMESKQSKSRENPGKSETPPADLAAHARSPWDELRVCGTRATETARNPSLRQPQRPFSPGRGTPSPSPPPSLHPYPPPPHPPPPPSRPSIPQLPPRAAPSPPSPPISTQVGCVFSSAGCISLLLVVCA
jgi:hypothetical protein